MRYTTLFPWLLACSTTTPPDQLALSWAGPPVVIDVGEAVPGEALLISLDNVPDGAVIEAAVGASLTPRCDLELAGLCSEIRPPVVMASSPAFGGEVALSLMLPAIIPPGTTLYVQVAGRIRSVQRISGVMERVAGGAPPPESTCDDVQAVVDANCTGCHGAAALGDLDLRDVSTAVGVTGAQSALALVEPGDRSASYLYRKVEGTHLAVGSGSQMPPTGTLDADALEQIGQWIDDGATCGDPPTVPVGDSHPNDLDQAALFTCDGGPSSSEARLRRIDRDEWRKSNGRQASSPAADNPFAPPESLRYSTYAEDVSIDPTALDLYLDVVDLAGISWQYRWNSGVINAHRPRHDDSLRCFWEDAAPDDPCIENFIRTYLVAGSLFREPLQEEVDRLMTLAHEVLAEEPAAGGERGDTVLQLTSAVWLTSGALFRNELGEGTPDAYGRVRLSDEEIGRMVGTMLSDFAPGAQGMQRHGLGPPEHPDFLAPYEGYHPDILTAVADSTIQQPSVIAGLVRSHAAGIDPSRVDVHVDDNEQWSVNRGEYWMADKLARFFLEWLDVTEFPNVFKEETWDTSQFQDGDAVLIRRIDRAWRNLQDGASGWDPTMLQALTDTIARIVVEDTDVFSTLLTTDRWYLPSTARYLGTNYEYQASNTHRPFNLLDDVGATRAEQWVTMPTGERAGLVTHPAFLATHGDAFEDGPSIVHRGRWVRENLLCETVPSLELVMVDAQLLPSDGTKTARERVAESIDAHPECMACHGLMNSLGRPFEVYNHAGFVREEDHGAPPDGSTVVDNAPDPALNRSYTDAVDMMTAFAGSEHVKRCMIRQTFRFFAGRDETLADACVLTDMEQAYDDSGGSFLALLETLAGHDTLLYRHVTEEVGP